tara:strand:+ start:943 stop:1257 length:315 start_codon:yes stop_codon:yes gene_type:complete
MGYRASIPNCPSGGKIRGVNCLRAIAKYLAAKDNQPTDIDILMNEATLMNGKIVRMATKSKQALIGQLKAHPDFSNVRLTDRNVGYFLKNEDSYLLEKDVRNGR